MRGGHSHNRHVYDERATGDSPRCAEAQKYRDFIAGILDQARMDAEYSRADDAVAAYRWVSEAGDIFRKYCMLLDIDPVRFRAAYIAKYGGRCEPLIRKLDAATEEQRKKWAEAKQRKEERDERKAELNRQYREAVRHNKNKKRGQPSIPHPKRARA